MKTTEQKNGPVAEGVGPANCCEVNQLNKTKCLLRYYEQYSVNSTDNSRCIELSVIHTKTQKF